ncbi:MAG: hypothetical protein IPO78_11100 [Saprospiraceae bacterium]|nr:hypothetical protein [Saprospiraceae bacterium]
MNQADENIQSSILNYEVSTDLLVNMPDSEILDIFGRLNSYSVTLNEQEKIHANHFGPFKTLADRVAHSYNSFWIDNKILSDKEVLRMADVNLCADLLIAMIEGIKSKKQIKSFYASYEREFEHDPVDLESKFSSTITTIQGIFGTDLKETEFKRIHIFYTLFTVIFHLKFGLPGNDKARLNITEQDFARVESRLENINSIFTTEEPQQLNATEVRFLEDSRRATTDKAVRERRTQYLIDIILQ